MKHCLYRKHSGFTLTELIIVVVLVAIVSLIGVQAISSSITPVTNRGKADELLSALVYARSVAVAQRRVVCTTYDSANREILFFRTKLPASDCSVTVPLNQTDEAKQLKFSWDEDITLTQSNSAPMQFYSSGKSNINVSYTLDGEAVDYVIKVDKETGWIGYE